MRQTDPHKLGERLLTLREAHPELKLSEVYDKWKGTLEGWETPVLPKHTSMQTEATKVYQRELRERAEAGDRYAKSVLEGSGWNEP